MLLRLRAEGRVVLLQSATAQHRLPVVAAVYGSRITGRPAHDILKRLDRADGTLWPAFEDILRRWD